MTAKKDVRAKSPKDVNAKSPKYYYGEKNVTKSQKPNWSKSRVETSSGEFFNFEKFGDTLDGIYDGEETYETGNGKKLRKVLVLCFILADGTRVKTSASYILEKAYEEGKFIIGARYYICFTDVRGKNGVKIFDIYTDYDFKQKKVKK